MERDPSKRRVKPVEPHLLQLEFAASSSDDSDFKVVTDDDSGLYDVFIFLDCLSLPRHASVCYGSVSVSVRHKPEFCQND